MEKIVLNALERLEKSHKVRRKGFVPGVIYGEGLPGGVPIMFERSKIDNVLHKHGVNSKIWVKAGEDENLGIIKEIQRDPLTGATIHLDIQRISGNENITLRLPIIFSERHKLEERKLLLQINLSEIEVSGRADLLPEHVVIDVAKMNQGDIIKIKDLPLEKQIRIHHDANETVAVITALKEHTVHEEPKETENTEG